MPEFTDTDRWNWWFGGHKRKREEYVSEYLRGVEEKWTPDQWRGYVDDRLREESEVPTAVA